MELQKISYYLSQVLNKYIYSIIIKDGYIILNVNAKYIYQVVKFLKLNSILLYDSLLDIWGTDDPSRINRFEVNYLFSSLRFSTRIWLKVYVNSDDSLESVTSLYSSGNWLEREVWDMYGVYFQNHMDLRRILTDYGFEGHPLRKDFPLSGYTEVRYDDGEKRVVTEPVELSQDFRYFNFLNPWESK